MPASAIALSLAAAFLHAGWNVLLAGSRDTRSTGAGLLVYGVLFMAAPALLTGGVSSEAVPYVVASAALELVYFALLARAYQTGEVSVIYPIARGSAPVLVLVVGALALNEEVSVGAAAGVALIVLGILIVGLPSAERAFAGRDVGFGLVIGALIASYTMVDSEAMEHARPVAYLALVVAPVAVLYPLVTRTRPDLGARTAATALVSFGAYLLALWAFRLAPAAPVAAVRESSVVIAAILAAVFLHEDVGPRKVAGALAVVAGVALIAYS